MSMVPKQVSLQLSSEYPTYLVYFTTTEYCCCYYYYYYYYHYY